MFTHSLCGHIYVPVVDHRIATHIDYVQANVESEGPATPAIEEPTAVTLNSAIEPVTPVSTSKRKKASKAKTISP
jgi:hypothetical protein